MKAFCPSSPLSIKKIVLIAMVLFFVFLLKSYYSSADSDSLFWVLSPTAFVVELFAGISFCNEPGVGWVNRIYDVVIAPSCSGVNFMIMIFCMSSLRIICSRLSLLNILQGLAVTAVLSYVSTLMVNGLRIWLSIGLYQTELFAEWLAPEEVHRIAGVFMHYLFLCFYYLLVSFILDQRLRKGQRKGNVFSITGQILVFMVPLCWYLLFSLGVPYINTGYALPSERFAHHSLAVFGTSALLTIVLSVIALTYRRVICFYQKYVPRWKNGKAVYFDCRG